MLERILNPFMRKVCYSQKEPDGHDSTDPAPCGLANGWKQMADFIVPAEDMTVKFPVIGETDPWITWKRHGFLGGLLRRRSGLRWMRKNSAQRRHWYAAYRNNAPEDTTRGHQ